MANTAKNAILRAKIEGVLTELMVKTNADNVYVDDTTTLAAKLAELITEIGTKASSASVSESLAALKQEMLGDTPVEAYNTFTELAQYIAEHKEAADALTAAIGAKANQSTVDEIIESLDALGELASLDKVSESNLDDALREKVNAASEGNHAHLNKELLDTYDQTNEDIKNAIAKKHSHANASVLDSITEEIVDGWNAKGNIYYSSTEPATLTENDLWVQLVD